MKYWFDTEFHDDGYHVELISIGVLAEDGREYYAVSGDYNPQRANEFIRDHVLPHLGSARRRSQAEIRDDLLAFFSASGMPTEFWADHGEYDWIVLRQLFGNLMSWPKGWPKTAMDVEQYRLMLRAGAFPSDSVIAHNALEDARSVRERWRWLEGKWCAAGLVNQRDG